MAKRTKYTSITHIPGQIRIMFQDGTNKIFKNSTEAQQYFDDNYGDGYSMEIVSQTDDGGKVTINGEELPKVVGTGKGTPKEPEPVDPVRAAIFEGRYNGRKFTPTPQNIQHFLDLYDSDKRISEEYGNKAWGKVLGTHLLAGAGIYAALTAPMWAPAAGNWLWNTGAPLAAKHIIAPTAAGMAWDEGQRALTGTTTTEQISNWLQKKKGWNPMAADMVGGFSNPGYWINFGGTGQYTRPFFNKIGLGLTSKAGALEWSPAIWANINSLMPKSKLQTKVVDPALKYLDKNLYKVQRITSPWLIGSKPTTFQTSDLPRFKFVKDASELQPLTDNMKYHTPDKGGQVWDYLLFRSNRNNERVFGDALTMRPPEINSKFYTQDFLGSANILDKGIFSPVTAGAAATDIVASDDRNPYVRGLEYALLGRFGLQWLISNRVRNATSLWRNYRDRFMTESSRITDFFRSRGLKTRQPEGYKRHWTRDSNSSIIYVPQGSHAPVNKNGFNYENATFDDLIKFLDKNGSRNTELMRFSTDQNTLYGPSDQVIARRTPNGKIEIVNEYELRSILAKDIDIVDYATGQRFTGKISVGNDGTVSMPEEYQRILKNNIDYVQNTLFPGSGVKVFGSSAGVTEAGFPHATHDIDFYITQNEINKLLEKGILSESDRINPGTYTYRHNPSQFGEQGNIDLNVIEQTPEGMATGIRAEELYRQYFPDEYFQALRDFKARQSNNDVDQAFHINKTPEELLEAMNPSSKTIMDAFDIDYTAPAKDKHALRSWTHLVYSDPAQVSQGLNQYAQSMLGSRVRLFPMSAEQLGDKELNLQALEKLGIKLRDFEMDRIASDPQRMKNVLDAWYMMDNTAMRYIKGTWPGTAGYSSENFVRSATIWDPINNHGNARGAGLNTAISGDSNWFGDLKAFISPRTEYKSSNLLDLIDEINNNFGRNPEASTLLREASRGLPEEQVNKLQSIYDTRGWNFLQDGKPYGAGMYASATRPFDINSDFIGFSPIRTVLNPLIPRIAPNPEQNPLSSHSWANPFRGSRKIIPETDYHLAKTFSLSPIFQANRERWQGWFNPNRNFTYSDIIPGKAPAIIEFGMVPGSYGVYSGVNYLTNQSLKQDIQNWTTQSDEIIQGMSDQDRQLFTPEGVDSLYQHLREDPEYEGATPEDLDYFVHWELESTYNRYKKAKQ